MVSNDRRIRSVSPRRAAPAPATRETLLETAEQLCAERAIDERRPARERAALRSRAAALAGAREARSVAWVALCKALGGGWDGAGALTGIREPATESDSGAAAPPPTSARPALAAAAAAAATSATSDGAGAR
jgi:hypothetical protein